MERFRSNKVAELRTEEEQLEAIKSWWKDNGKSLVIMIAIAVSAVYGYKGWQNKQITNSENASLMYQQLIASTVSNSQSDTEKNFATSKHLAKTLKSDFADTQYAKFAALLMAKVAVNNQDLSLAEQELDWVLEQDPQPLVKAIAQLRKAQIQNENKNYSQALSLLSSISVESLKGPVAELEGDIYLAQGDKEKARTAYQQAISNTATSNDNAVITMKLNDLTTEEG